MPGESIFGERCVVCFADGLREVFDFSTAANVVVRQVKAARQCECQRERNITAGCKMYSSRGITS